MLKMSGRLDFHATRAHLGKGGKPDGHLLSPHATMFHLLDLPVDQACKIVGGGVRTYDDILKRFNCQLITVSEPVMGGMFPMDVNAIVHNGATISEHGVLISYKPATKPQWAKVRRANADLRS